MPGGITCSVLSPVTLSLGVVNLWFCRLRGSSSVLTEKAMASHSITVAWKIPWTEEPGRLQSMGSRRVGHDWATEWLHFSLSCIGEGNGNPLQCSCLENARDGGASWAAIYGVAQSRTRLKQLSSSSSSTHESSSRHICSLMDEGELNRISQITPVYHLSIDTSPKFLPASACARSPSCLLLRESFPRQVNKKSRGPQGERGLEFSRRKNGQAFFPLYIP